MSEDRLFTRVCQCTLMGAPFWWLLGFNLFVYHFVAAFLLLRMVHRYTSEDRGIYVPPSAIYLMMIMTVYFFSLLINGMSADTMRMMASVYNLSYWGMGFSLVLVLANTCSFSHMKGFLKAFLWLGCAIAIMGILVFIVSNGGRNNLAFHTPLYGLTRILGHTTLVENSLMAKPLSWDWLASVRHPRLNLMSPYPTASGGVIMLIVVMTVTWGMWEKKLRSPLFLLLVIANMAALFMTLSRMPIIALGVSFVGVLLIQRRHAILWILAFLLLLSVTLPWLEKMTEWVLGLRGGSTTGRIALYQESFRQMSGVDWILGMGFKPRVYLISTPLGSHSTIISLIYKTGVSGAIIFIIFQAHLLWRWFSMKAFVVEKKSYLNLWFGLGWALSCMAMLMITEDIDAPQLLAFAYFVLLGIFEAYYRERVPE
ncbi:MAG: hypothetical protein Q8R76_01600 [Candidatus Omnitrophota bacterium]|nr:hypothetical protein [Candidatus Omnitrophota bacterium]